MSPRRALHPEDVEKLVGQMARLAGNAVIVELAARRCD
jgi:hypothetical protein